MYKKIDKRQYLPILSVTEENDTHMTFEFNNVFDAKPGQFFMITDYENGEKPFSLSRITDSSVFFTVKKLGCFTQSLFKKNVGENLSIRGPYGNGFPIGLLGGKKIAVLGGGCGTGPVRALCESVKGISDILIINGAKTKDELLFIDEISSFSNEAIIVTDDGTHGEKGNVLTVCKNRVDLRGCDFIFVSGPEVMLKSVLQYLDSELQSVPAFFLIERYMKCAIGICGQCSVDPLGVRVCVEGPVFDKGMLSSLHEFGDYKRDASGQRITV